MYKPNATTQNITFPITLKNKIYAIWSSVSGAETSYYGGVGLISEYTNSSVNVNACALMTAGYMGIAGCYGYNVYFVSIGI